MLLQTSNTLEDLVVRTLAQNPGLSAQALQAKIAKEHGRFTLRGIYKQLHSLQAEGIVSKLGETYSLRFDWIVNLLSFADKMYESYLTTFPRHYKIPAEGEKTTWKFSNLLKMDAVWMQLSLSLLPGITRKEVLWWCPHPWFHLAYGEREREFNQAGETLGSEKYIIIGGRTYLDRQYPNYLSETWQHSFAESPFENERARSFKIIDDYISTVKTDKQTTERIENFFASVKSAKDLSPLLVQEFFQAPAGITLTLERDAKKAAKFRSRFYRYFGFSAEKTS